MKEKRMIKIASLNLWRFNEWERRLPLIVESIKKVNPDIIFFQEMQTDISFDKRNQLDILNSFLKYPHQMFTLADIKTKRKGVPLSHPVDHGLGVLSKFEFSTDKIMLTKAEDDKEQRILQVNNFNIDGQNFNLANIHFSNSDKWAEAHFKETLDILKDKKTGIIGDFNIKDIKKYRELFEKVYISSADFKDYVSYPEDNLSYDYMLIPNDYIFDDFECIDANISDHRMIVAEISM